MPLSRNELDTKEDDGSKQYKWKDNNDYWRLMAQNPWYKDWSDESKQRLQNDIKATYKGGKQNDK